MWLHLVGGQESLFADESLFPQSCPADHPAALLLSEHDSNKTPTPSPPPRLEAVLPPAASPVIPRGQSPK